VTVHVHIDRVVVEGLPLASRDRRALGDAIEHELRRLLGNRAWPAHGAVVRRVFGPPLPPVEHATAPAYGAAIAQSIGGGIGTAVAR
jgi:hypothetical protein